MREVFVIGALRTPVGKAPRGTLRHTRPDDLGAAVVRALVERSGAPAEAIEDVVIGCAMPEAEQGMNVGRNIALLAGLPDSVPGMTVNRFCSSGLETINIAAGQIATGQSDLVIAGGAESMSLVPMGGHRYLPNPTLLDDDPETYLNMGLTAENLADRDAIDRETQDRFALDSHRKALAAIEAERFVDETVPIEAELAEVDGDGKPRARKVTFAVDEGPRAGSSLEALGKLRPAFKASGSVTAGNSSQMSDGAAAVLLASAEAVERHGLTPIARFRGYAVAGVAPEIMGIGPVEAIPKLLGRVGVDLGEVDVIELNEAFAAQSLAVIKHLGIDAADERLNPNGGAIALGHPLGCTGAKLTATALAELRRREGRYALVTMCVGTGMGAAGLFERV